MRETSEQRAERIKRTADSREKCAVCGYLQINVRHEPDPDNAPEGREYYAAMRAQLHPFAPSGKYDR